MTTQSQLRRTWPGNSPHCPDDEDLEDSRVFLRERQMVDEPGEVLVHLETGWLTTQATGVAISTILHLSHHGR